jgi:hypothetical protein
MLAAPSVVAVAILAALLCITIIGIPVAIAGLFGYFAFLGVLFLWGYVVGAAYLGERILARGAIHAGAAPVTAAGSPAAAGPTATAPTLVRAALTGVLVLAGAEFVKRLLQLVPGLGWLGTLIGVLAWIALALLTMLGAGAWLRNELRYGILARWWRGRAATPPAPPAPGASGAAAAAPGAPPGSWTPDLPVAPGAPPGSGAIPPAAPAAPGDPTPSA